MPVDTASLTATCTAGAASALHDAPVHEHPSVDVAHVAEDSAAQSVGAMTHAENEVEPAGDE